MTSLIELSYGAVTDCWSRDAAPIERQWAEEDRARLREVAAMVKNVRIFAETAIKDMNLEISKDDLRDLIAALDDAVGDTIGAWLKYADAAEADNASPLPEHWSERTIP